MTIPADFYPPVADENSTDTRDMTSMFNSPLDEGQKSQFEAWQKEQSAKIGRDLSKDLYDYDLQGYWKDNQGKQLDSSHLPDTYKKPNHPTFSSESMHHGSRIGTDWNLKARGGEWQDLGNGKYSFTPGNSNFEYHSPQELIDYFKKNEPGNTLILPGY